MPSNFEALLEEAVRNLYDALVTKPRAYYHIGSEEPAVRDELTVVFTDGTEVMLNCDGRGEYDYDAMAMPKYPADATKTQIINLAAHKCVRPVAVRYMLNDERELKDAHARNQVRIEVPYDFVRRVFDGKSNGETENGSANSTSDGVVSIPYKVIGGVMTIDTKVTATHAVGSAGTKAGGGG